ncbi:MAG: alpha/beta hydrolase [Deltaproteobacteria bacterium]|jgi:pimeloyl-ACP methyl ester carboxylesterase|nr:alpha/beta hydrolase [Deltaproteobacteria bacterium]MBW2533461.1 alpha/beta hydrolase [Deltaproteobacteria bacterium]
MTTPPEPFGVPGADPIGAEDATFSESYVDVGDGVRLRVMHWRPRMTQRQRPLLFVAGWISVVQGWADFLRAAARHRPVFYVESREKVSAQFDRTELEPSDFTIERCAEDLVALCRALPIDVGETIVAGSSFGATSLIEAFKDGRLRPRGAFLVGPNSEFRIPWTARLVWHLPNPFFLVVKHAIVWHLRTFRIDVEAEPEQMQRYEQTVMSAHPGRLKLSARAITGYQIWPNLEQVSVPVAVAYAPSDKLHGAANVRRISETLPSCTLVQCASNLAMHSAQLVDDVERFIADLDRDPR